MKITSVLKIDDGREIKSTTEGKPTEEELELFKETENLFNKYAKEGLIPATLRFEFEE